MEEFSIPVIDMSRAKTDRVQLAHKLVHGLKNIGFLYIPNFGKIYLTPIIHDHHVQPDDATNCSC
jgi:hypothetical protein